MTYRSSEIVLQNIFTREPSLRCFIFPVASDQIRVSNVLGYDSEPKEIEIIEMNPEISAKHQTEMYTSTETRVQCVVDPARVIQRMGL